MHVSASSYWTRAVTSRSMAIRILNLVLAATIKADSQGSELLWERGERVGKKAVTQVLACNSELLS